MRFTPELTVARTAPHLKATTHISKWLLLPFHARVFIQWEFGFEIYFKGWVSAFYFVLPV